MHCFLFSLFVPESPISGCDSVVKGFAFLDPLPFRYRLHQTKALRRGPLLFWFELDGFDRFTVNHIQFEIPCTLSVKNCI